MKIHEALLQVIHGTEWIPFTYPYCSKDNTYSICVTYPMCKRKHGYMLTTHSVKKTYTTWIPSALTHCPLQSSVEPAGPRLWPSSSLWWLSGDGSSGKSTPRTPVNFQQSHHYNSSIDCWFWSSKLHNIHMHVFAYTSTQQNLIYSCTFLWTCMFVFIVLIFQELVTYPQQFTGQHYDWCGPIPYFIILDFGDVWKSNSVHC